MSRGFLSGLFKVAIGKKTGYTRKGFWGQTIYYNKDGERKGWSRKNFWGGRNRYNNDNELTSYTLRNFGGGYDTYDPQGNRIKRSRKNFWGGYNTYDLDDNLETQTLKNHLGGVNIYDAKENENTMSAKPKSKAGTGADTFRVPSSTASQMTFTAKQFNDPSVKNSVKSQAETVRNVNDFIPKQVIDNKISLFDSIEEGIAYHQIPLKFVKIVAYQYEDMKEFPALCYVEDDYICAAPMMRDSIVFRFFKTDVAAAKMLTAAISYEQIENEFLALCTSRLNSDFESLLPEYEFDGLDGKVLMYELPCGLKITGNSYQELKKL